MTLDYYNTCKQQLIERFHDLGAIKRGKFQLSGGGESDVYVDCRRVVLDHEGLFLVTSMMKQLCVQRGWKMDSVGGPAMSAIPIVTGMVAHCLTISSGFYVRKEIKSHGLIANRIEGEVGNLPLLVDDVYTTGKSIKETVQILAEQGMPQPLGVMVIVDRRERHAALPVPFASLLTIDELLV